MEYHALYLQPNQNVSNLKDAKVEQQRKDEKEETKLRDSKCFYKNAEK